MTDEHHTENSLTRLVNRVLSSKDQDFFCESMSHVAMFTKYSVYNSFLIHLQSPYSTYVATETIWKSDFNREIKDNAKPIFIFDPEKNIDVVYDASDIEGSEPCYDAVNSYRIGSEFDDYLIVHLYENALKEGVVDNNKLDDRMSKVDLHVKSYGVDLNKFYNERDNDTINVLSIFIKELSHVYLGHTGSDLLSLGSHSDFSRDQMEFEAGLVSFLSLMRLGFYNKAHECLSAAVEKKMHISNMFFDFNAVARVAQKIIQNAEFSFYDYSL